MVVARRVIRREMNSVLPHMTFVDARWDRILGERDACDHDLAFVFDFPHAHLHLQFRESSTEFASFLVVINRADNSDGGNDDQHDPHE